MANVLGYDKPLASQRAYTKHIREFERLFESTFVAKILWNTYLGTCLSMSFLTIGSYSRLLDPFAHLSTNNKCTRGMMNPFRANGPIQNIQENPNDYLNSLPTLGNPFEHVLSHCRSRLLDPLLSLGTYGEGFLHWCFDLPPSIEHQTKTIH